MPAAAIVTLIGVGLLVVALVGYLVRVALSLRHVIRSLGLVTFGLRAIAHQTEPLNGYLTEIRADIDAIDAALNGLLEAKRATAAEEV